MPRQKIISRLQEIDDFIQLIETERDDDKRNLLIRLCCIRISGNIERCIEIIFTEYLDRRSHPRIKNFVKKVFNKGTNYKSQKIVNMLGSFDTDWGAQMTSFLDQSERRDRMNSIYNNRVQIAHGHSVSLTTSRLKEFNEVHREVINMIADKS